MVKSFSSICIYFSRSSKVCFLYFIDITKYPESFLSNFRGSCHLTSAFFVPGTGIEPVWRLIHWCLRPARLPIPPSGRCALACKSVAKVIIIFVWHNNFITFAFIIVVKKFDRLTYEKQQVLRYNGWWHREPFLAIQP